MLEHVFAAVHDVTGGSVLDGLERADVSCAPISDGKGVAFDGLDGSPDGICGVALWFGVVVFGVEGFLGGGFDVLSAVSRCAF